MNTPFVLDDSYLTLVGRVAVAGSLVEGCLDGMIAVITKIVDPDFATEQFPLQFGRKLEFIKKHFKTAFPHPDKIALQRAICSEAKLVSNVRNLVIHGFLDLQTAVPPGFLLISKLEPEGKRAKTVTTIVKLETIHSIADRAMNLQAKAARLLNEMAQEIGFQFDHSYQS